MPVTQQPYHAITHTVPFPASCPRRPARLVALTIAVGPVVFAALLCKLTNDRFKFAWPFHKEKLFGSFGLHFLLGLVLATGPIYQTAMISLA